MTALDLSFFAGKLDNQPQAVAWSWEQLAARLQQVERSPCSSSTCGRWQTPQLDCAHKDGGALWSPASYPPGARRAKVNVAAVSALVLDVDHLDDAGVMAAFTALAAYRLIAHSSHSDRPGDRCLRFVVALSRPVLGHEWPRFWDAAVAALGIPVDKATRDASRLFYWPSRPADAPFCFGAQEGAALDVEAVLASAPPAPEPAAVTPQVAVTLGSAAPVPQEQFLAAARKLAAIWAPTGYRHAAHRALRGGLALAGWDIEHNAVFCAAVAQLAGHESPDGDLAKRYREAQQTAISLEAGETVEQWGTLVDRLSEHHPRATVMAAIDDAQVLLGIVGAGAAQAASFVAQAQAAGLAPPTPPPPAPMTREQLAEHFKITKTKLARRTSITDRLDAKYLSRIFERSASSLAREDDDPDTDALAATAVALVRHAPAGTPDDALASLLGRFARPEAALAAVGEARVTAAAATPIAFEMESSGPRAGKPAASQANIKRALELARVAFRYDLLADRMVMGVADADSSTFTVVEDHHLAELRLQIETVFGFKSQDKYFAEIVESLARSNAFHPVRDYLDALPPWDGVPRIGSWLVEYGGAENTPFNRAVGRIVLVAAVRRARQPGCKFDEMLILEGSQGCGKSTAVRLLAVRDEWFGDKLPLGDNDQRKQLEAISGRWIMEAGELGGMAKAEVAELKAFLSAQEDKARLAYARLPVTRKRQCVLIGTTNEETYLRDGTGNRRYWPVRVQTFDLEGLKAAVPLLWAEAAAAEAAGESIRLAPELYGDANAVQEARRVEDPFVDMLATALGDATGKLLALDAWRILDLDPGRNAGAGHRIGAAMRALGWERRKARYPGQKLAVHCYLRGTEEQRTQAVKLDGGAIGGWRVAPVADSAAAVTAPN